MRLLCDTNILVSYLLTPEKAGPIHTILQGAFLGEFTLLIPEDLLQELARKVKGKKYLAGRITADELDELAKLLEAVGEVIPRINMPIPAVTRDPKDDYLLAYALVGEADVLVTGDADLLTIREAGHTRIMTARQFTSFMRPK